MTSLIKVPKHLPMPRPRLTFSSHLLCLSAAFGTVASLLQGFLPLASRIFALFIFVPAQPPWLFSSFFSDLLDRSCPELNPEPLLFSPCITHVEMGSSFMTLSTIYIGLARWQSGRESICQCRRHKRHGFDLWMEKIHWKRKWQPTPVCLPGKFHRQRRLAVHSPWDLKELDPPEHPCTRTPCICWWLPDKTSLDCSPQSRRADSHLQVLT